MNDSNASVAVPKAKSTPNDDGKNAYSYVDLPSS